MSIFKRRTAEQSAKRAFWREPPFPSSNPEVLHQHGISCVAKSDGPGMMSVGWALWDIAGLNQQQAWDFLYDGYRQWRNSGAPDPDRALFLLQVLERLTDIRPAIPPGADLRSLSPGIVAPAATYYAARGWAVSELLEVARATNTLTPDLQDRLLGLLATTHREFMAPRTLETYTVLQRSRESRTTKTGP